MEMKFILCECVSERGAGGYIMHFPPTIDETSEDEMRG